MGAAATSVMGPAGNPILLRGRAKYARRVAIPKSGEGNLARAMASLEGVPLLDTIVRRRSRRFALGHDLDGGPLSYRSKHEPVPLSLEEEAIIVFAGSGITGFSLGELPYSRGKNPASGGGNIMVTPFARTISSADGVNSAILFVLNDDGAFQIRRPAGPRAGRLAGARPARPRAPVHGAVSSGTGSGSRTAGPRFRGRPRTRRPSTSGRRTSRARRTACSSPSRRRSP